MIQGGDPTGTGRGGESVFGRKFEVQSLPLALTLEAVTPAMSSVRDHGF